MGYEYQKEKPYVLTDEGQRKLLKVRDFADKACRMAGAVRADKLMAVAGAGDSWSLMATVDRLVEIGDLLEVPTGGAWQCRVFTRSGGDEWQ